MARRDDNQLLTTLRIVEALGVAAATSEDLMERFELTRPTLMRYLAEARHLGARIEARQASRRWMYHLANADEVRVRTRRWIELEESCDLRRMQPELQMG